MRTNKVPTGPYRGAGRPEAAYFVECTVDVAARELGIDPLELRRRNLIRELPLRDGARLDLRLRRLRALPRPRGGAREARARAPTTARVVGTGFGDVRRARGRAVRDRRGGAAAGRAAPGAQRLVAARPGPRHDLRAGRGRAAPGRARGRGAPLRRLEGGARAAWAPSPAARWRWAGRRWCRRSIAPEGEVRRGGRRGWDGECLRCATIAEAEPGLRGERPLRVRPRLLVRRLRSRRRDRARHRAAARAAAGGGRRRRHDRQPAAGRGTGDRRHRAGARRSASSRRRPTTRRATRPSPRSPATAC